VADQKQCDGSGKVPNGPRHSSGHPNGPWVDCPGCSACLPKTDNLPAECGGSGSFDAMSGDLRVRVDCPGCDHPDCPNRKPQTDHVEEAKRWSEAADLEGVRGASRSVQYAAIAQAHASAAIAQELRGIREALGDYLGDDSHLDKAVQALRAIAEPDKYGIDPRTLGR